MRFVNADGITSCCGAYSTYVDMTEVCKVCYEEVVSETRGTEVKLPEVADHITAVRAAVAAGYVLMQRPDNAESREYGTYYYAKPSDVKLAEAKGDRRV